MRKINKCIMLLTILAALLITSCSAPAAEANTGTVTETVPVTEAVSETKAITTTEATTITEATTTATQEAPDMEKFKDMITELAPSGFDANREGAALEFQRHRYYSSTADRDTSVNIFLPPNYSEDKEYPVVYILHGYYDNENWMARPEVNIQNILGNLNDSGEAEEMIVVMPYIYCDKLRPTVTGMDLSNSLSYDNFINDLTTDLMPFIEDTFSVKKGRENTAITGFSMGGRESLFIGFQHPELFGYIGAVCPAPGLVEIPNSPAHPGQMTKEEMIFPEDKPYALLVSWSGADGVVGSSPNDYCVIMENNGVDYLLHKLTSTGHDHSSVRPHLYNFFRMLFK